MNDPESIEILRCRSRLNMEETLNHVKSISENICCQDETNLINLQTITNNQHKIIPSLDKDPEHTVIKTIEYFYEII
jgi:hypothetical protein